MGNSLEHATGTFGSGETDFHVRNIEKQSKAEIHGKNISISGHVEGKSEVVLRATGTIVIGRIEEKSVVYAYGETVVVRRKIEGQSKLFAYCKELVVLGTIEGQSYVAYSNKGRFTWGLKGNSIFTKMEAPDVHGDEDTEENENVREALLIDTTYHHIPVGDIVDVGK